MNADQLETPVLERLRQPLETLLILAEREVESREFQRRNVSLGRARVQFLQNLERLAALA